MGKALKTPKRQTYRAFAHSLSKGMLRSVDRRVLPFDRAEKAYNVDVSSGALKPSYGIADTGLAYERIFYYTWYDAEASVRTGTYLGYRAGNIYALGETETQIEGVAFAAPPTGVNYRLYGEDVFLLCGAEGMAVVHADLSATTVPSAPAITALAMHNERMFVTIGGRKNAVWFSDDLDPTNWNPELDEGGFIELEGEGGATNKVVDFGGYVYIFRDYGIMRLTAYGDQSEFSLTGLFVSSGRIFADTVTVCGDRILFCASDGPYVFDGLSATRILRDYDGAFSPAKPVAAYSGGKYFLATKLTETEGEGNDALVCIDPKTGSACVSEGVYIDAFSPIAEAGGEKLFCHTDRETLGKVTRGATYYDLPRTCLWQGTLSDMGSPDREKLITELFIDTAMPVTVRVFTERGERQLRFSGKRAVQRKRVNLIGTKAGIAISADGDIDAARPALRFTYIGS
ncbi:MAG: hypothetical protein K2M95_06460 [Clostridiales bacterium]|nr:hypothetical protein [Clostridiales bacterium]